MNDAMFEMFCAAAIVTIVMIVIETITTNYRPGARGVPSIALALVLLLVGTLMTVAGHQEYEFQSPWLANEANRDFIQNIVGFFAGALFLAFGLFRRLRGGVVREQIRQLSETLGATTKELTSTQELMTSLIRSSISGVMVLYALRDVAGSIVDFECRLMNEEAEQLLGRSSNALVGRRLIEHLPCLKSEGLFDDAVSVIETRLPFRGDRCCKQGGKERWYQIAMVRHGDGIVTTFADVSNRKRTEEQLRHAAEHDTLTGLPSRSLLSDRLDRALNRAKRSPGYKFAVLFLDFDRLKIINDSLGHEVGDQLLISISDRLRANLRDIDTPARVDEEHLPARVGGDEFVILLDGIQDARDTLIVAERLQKALSTPHQLDGHEVISTASIGIVVVDGNYDCADDILRDADTAMYQAKNSGKGRHVVFDEAMHNDGMQRLKLERELRTAAEQLEFALTYQPIVSLETASLVGFEALIRWPHSERGIILPANFIALAEELGLIVSIGQWVLREAVAQLKRWHDARPDLAPLSMSINLSKQQLTHPELLDDIGAALEETGLPAGSLVLDITESELMGNPENLTPVLEKLRGLGVRLAMDDFGTGHSSLSFLRQAPMDFLKIDRSFINNPGKTRDYGAIIHTVVQLAHNLDMLVVAKGIETPEQLVLMQSLDCNYGQGFLFSKPIDADEAGKLLDDDFRFTLAA